MTGERSENHIRLVAYGPRLNGAGGSSEPGGEHPLDGCRMKFRPVKMDAESTR